MQVPSGSIYSEYDLELLRRMAQYGFVRHADQPFRLRSGIESCVYVFGREDLTDHPDLEMLVGRKVAEVVFRDRSVTDRQPCLIGLPTAGTAIAQAAAMVSFWRGAIGEAVPDIEICHRIMRETKKRAHGASQHQGFWVNGRPDLDRHTYWGADNVATDGQTKVDAALRLVEDGYPAYEMPWLIFIDRQQGAVERLRSLGFNRISVALQLLDITFVFGELGLWPKSAVQAVEEEIRAHQLLKEA